MTQAKQNYIHVKQGEFRISKSPNDVLISVLGSCVAVCFYDPLNRIGGMNHFLLPGHDPKANQHNKYGAHAMEQLVNALLRAGASRPAMEAQVFGGAAVMRGRGKIGLSNAKFAKDFLEFEDYHLVRCDTGGQVGRRIQFHPADGQVELFRLRNDHKPQDNVAPAPLPKTGVIELF